MDAWVWIVIAVIFELLLVGAAAFFFVRQVEKKMDAKVVGLMVVDPEEPGAGDGVYTAFLEDPKTFTDGSRIVLEVSVVRK